MILRGGFTNYGEPVGILMLETRFPRPAGDIGNAGTFEFPVKYRIVRGASPERVVRLGDTQLLEPFIEAARELESGGVRAVTTSCGFLALFQKEIAAALVIPFFSSSLLQLPLVWRITGCSGPIGVLTVSAASLTDRHFEMVGAADIPRVVYGMDGSKEFGRVFMDSSLEGSRDSCTLDMELCTREIEDTAGRMMLEHPEVRAIVMECTNMPPFREAVRRRTGLPVFDIVTLTRYIYSSVRD